VVNKNIHVDFKTYEINYVQKMIFVAIFPKVFALYLEDEDISNICDHELSPLLHCFIDKMGSIPNRAQSITAMSSMEIEHSAFNVSRRPSITKR